MPYNKELANRIRKRLERESRIEEGAMQSGLAFIYKKKMCIGVFRNEMMCRINPGFHQKAVMKPGCRSMSVSLPPRKGYVMISEKGMKTDKDFNYWISLALRYNKRVYESKKKKSIIRKASE